MRKRLLLFSKVFITALLFMSANVSWGQGNLRGGCTAASVTQDLLKDITECENSPIVQNNSLGTDYVSFAKFDEADKDWIAADGAVTSLVNTNRSVFAWVKKSTQVTGSGQVIVGINTSAGGNICNLQIGTDEKLDVYDSANSHVGTTVITDGKWHHVGYTYDATTNETKVYVDGVVEATFTNDQKITKTTDKISLGQEFDSGLSTGNFFDGLMTEVSLWNDVLTKEEVSGIQKNAISNSHPKYSNLLAYYPMNIPCDEDLKQITDFSGNNNHGVTTASDIQSTENFEQLTDFNSGSHFTSIWKKEGTQVTTGSELNLSGSLSEAGNYSLVFTRDYLTISDDFMVTVNQTPVITNQPVNATSSLNGNVEFTTDFDATSFDAQWFKVEDDYTKIQSFPNNNLYDVYYNNGVMYVSSLGSFCISNDYGKTFETRTTADGLGHDQCYGAVAYNGKLFVATKNGISVSTDGGKTFINKGSSVDLNGSFCNSVYIKNNTIYGTTNNGYIFSNDGGETFNYAKINNQNHICNRIFIDDDNTMYIASGSGLAISKDNGTTFILKTTSNGLGNNYCKDVLKKDNKIYVATYNLGGLSISTDGGETFTNKTTSDGLGNNTCQNIMFHKEKLYVSTAGGLSISSDYGETFNNITTRDGLSSNSVRGITFNSNDILVSSTNGLTIIKDYKKLEGETAKKLSISNVTSEMDGDKYYAIVTNPTTGCSVTSNIVTLNVLDCFNTTVTDKITACGSYTWIDGVTYTESTNTPKVIKKSSEGCDIELTLNLTINKLPVISKQPIDHVTDTYQDLDFSVEVEGDNLNSNDDYTFQWGHWGWNTEKKSNDRFDVVYPGVDFEIIGGNIYSVGQHLVISKEDGEEVDIKYFNSKTTCIAYTNNIMFIGTESDGIYYSSDLGKKFTQITADKLGVSITPGQPNRIHSIDAFNGNIYATTDQGISISTDNGNTFSFTAIDIMHPTNDSYSVYGNFTYVYNNTIYVGCSRFGLSISTDNGTTFSKFAIEGQYDNTFNEPVLHNDTLYLPGVQGLFYVTKENSTPKLSEKTYKAGNLINSPAENKLDSDWSGGIVINDFGVYRLQRNSGEIFFYRNWEFYSTHTLESTQGVIVNCENIREIDNKFYLKMGSVIYRINPHVTNAMKHFSGYRTSKLKWFVEGDATNQIHGRANYYAVQVTDVETGCSVVSNPVRPIAGTVADITVSETELTVSEDLTTKEFTVVLTEQPTSDVVLNLSSNDTGEATVSPLTVTFKTDNWNIAKTVTVTGVNDDTIDGTQTANITISVDDNLSDDKFDIIEDQTVTVNVTDNDVAPTTYTATFAVVKEDNNPIPGATIEVNNQTLTANAYGVATIELTASNHPFTITANGFDNETGDATVVNKNVVLNIYMTKTAPTTYAVTFNVTDDETTKAIAGATIVIEGTTLTSDANGQAAINLTRGDHFFDCNANGYENINDEFTVKSSGENIVNIKLSIPEFEITFNVKDESGNLIEGASIVVDGETYTTDDNGATYVDLKAGIYPWTCDVNGFNQTTGNLEVTNKDEVVNVEMVKTTATTYKATFNVKGEDSNIIEGAKIVIDGKTLTTDASGQASIELPSNVYPWTCDADGFNQTTGNLEVTNKDEVVNVEMVKTTATTYKATFNVKGEYSKIIEGAKIVIDGKTLTTDASGVATIVLPNGNYSLLCNADGYKQATGNIAINNKNTSVTILLEKSNESKIYSTTILVLDENNQPISGAEVSVNNNIYDTNYSGEVTIDLNGGFYDYTVVADGFIQETGNFTLSSDKVLVTVILKKIITEVELPNGFSPNNDGQNDTFVIPNIDNYPNNSLQIINRWGNVVYKAAPYNNNWDGLSNKGLKINNQLPDGTYFYFFDKGNGEDIIKGFIRLKR